MSALRVADEFALFVEHSLAPALRALPFLKSPDAIYLKLISLAFVPASLVYLVVAIAKGRFNLHRFLGLYVLLFLVACGSAWFRYQIVTSAAGSFQLDDSIFSYRNVSLESILHPTLVALLVASVHFAFQTPGHPKHTAGSGSVYVQLWGSAVCLLIYGYSHYYLPQRQFIVVRQIAAMAYPILAAQYLFGADEIITYGRISTSLSAVFPTIFSLLTVAASWQLGFSKYERDSVMGFKFLSAPVEELAFYVLLCTGVVQALLIWESLAERPATPLVLQHEGVRARLVPMPKQKPNEKSQSAPSSAKNSPKSPEKTPSSPSTTAAAKSPSSPAATGSPNTSKNKKRSGN